MPVYEFVCPVGHVTTLVSAVVDVPEAQYCAASVDVVAGNVVRCQEVAVRKVVQDGLGLAIH